MTAVEASVGAPRRAVAVAGGRASPRRRARSPSTSAACRSGAPPGRRPVDDEHGHRGRRRHRDPGRAPRPRGQRARAGHRQQRRGGRGRPGDAAQAADLGVGVPVIGDFHYNGHQLLVEYPEMARGLAKYRINPGNVGAKRHDENFQTIVRVAIEQRQAGADRRQLGLARPGAAHRADGRERAAPPSRATAAT